MSDSDSVLCDHVCQIWPHSTATNSTSQIDTFFQELPVRPSEHVIIEAHPDVLAHMRDVGWHEKPGVKMLEGKWQDFIDGDELMATGGFDVIYTDTFSEDYQGRCTADIPLFFISYSL